MKFFRSNLAAFFLSALMLFTACTENTDGLVNDSNDPQTLVINKSKAEWNKYDRLLTDEQIEQIAIEHNEELEKLYSFNPRNFEEVTDAAVELYGSKKLDADLLNEYGEVANELNMELLLAVIDNTKEDFVDYELLKTKLTEMNSILDVEGLQEHEAATRRVLKGIDLDTYLVTSEVFQKSTQFWGDRYPEATMRERGGWREADGISASIGFFTMAAAFAAISAVGIATGGTGVIPTVTIVAGLLRIGASAALASIYAAFS